MHSGQYRRGGAAAGCGVPERHLALRLGACSAPMAWALRARAPAASLITASRSALGAEGAARLCIGRGSRWLPSPPRATRSAPRAWALRAQAPATAFSPPRATRSAPKPEGVGAARPGAYMLSPPVNCARCLLVVGTSKTSCASRCSRRSAQRALRAPAEGEGGEGWSRHHHARACGGTLVCCRSMCSASRRGAPLGSERLLPRPGRSPALSARVLQRFALERCAQAGAARRRPSRLRANNARPSRVPPRGGGLQDYLVSILLLLLKPPGK